MNPKLLSSALCLGLAACSTPPALVGGPDLQVVHAQALPAPDTADLISPERSYLIGPLDELMVDVYNVPELTRSVQVDASGRIAMPLVGSLQASGKTPADLANLIATSLVGRYVKNPQVTVNLTKTVSQTVTVDGEVRQPGSYPIAGRMTLMRAVARAQGTDEFAQLRNVVIYRRVNGQNLAALYDLRAIRQGLYGDPEIFPNDIVFVGDSNARRVFRDLLQGSGVLTAPLIAILQ